MSCSETSQLYSQLMPNVALHGRWIHSLCPRADLVV
eukprot:COSAG02_NODE_16822_length_1053_cov_1.307128_2_plen_36_part_01